MVVFRRVVSRSVCLVVLAAALTPASVHAICPDSQPLQHGLGSMFMNCPEPVTGFVYSLPVPDQSNAANSTGFDIICNAAGTRTLRQTIPCQVEAGTPSDGNVTVQFDWGGIGNVQGCPNSRGSLGVGRNLLQVVASDGSSLVASVGFSSPHGMYLLEAAHPLGPEGDSVMPLSCGAPGSKPFRIDRMANNGPDVEAELTLVAPRIYTDCDGGSAGQLIGTCTGGAPPSSGIGRIYTRSAPCGAPPDTYLAAGWTLAAIPDAVGRVTLTFPNPPDAGTCMYIGATLTLNGFESTMVAGMEVIQRDGICNDADRDLLTDCDGDCDDANPDIFIGQVEACNGIDDDCDGLVDEDQGQTTCGVGACARTVDDCLGGLAQTCVPGAPEVEACNGVDNNCNGLIDDIDLDLDGFSVCGPDCDDGDPSRNPAASEICNDIDDDCDGLVDEGDDGLDEDEDGVPDACDNCPSDDNPEQEDADDDGFGDLCDNCPSENNPDQEDSDGEGIGDACDNCLVMPNDQGDEDFDGFGDICDVCPKVSNPAQDPDSCRQEVVDLVFNEIKKKGARETLYSWRIPSESDLVGFNVVAITKKKKSRGSDERRGARVQLNSDLVPCGECETGRGAEYNFALQENSKRTKNAQVFIEMVRQGGIIELFGPAEKLQ